MQDMATQASSSALLRGTPADPTFGHLPPGTVFVVDDDVVQRLVLRAVLSAAGYSVEMFERADALLARVSTCDHGCVVVDLRMPGVDGLELQQALLASQIRMPVVFISGWADVASVVMAMKRGAIDFLTKPIDSERLIDVVASALREDAAAATRRAARAQARAGWATLSPREQQVCLHAARGLLHKQVAAELGVVENTVAVHRAAAFKKLRITSIVELIRLLDALDLPDDPKERAPFAGTSRHGR